MEKDSKSEDTSAGKHPAEDSPYDLFLLAMKTSATRKAYTNNLKNFFDKIGVDACEGDIEKRCEFAVKKAKESPEWLMRSVRDFAMQAKERLERKEISAGRVWNIIAAVRLFFSQSDFDVKLWNKYFRGLPQPRQDANDTIPTREEIVKLCKYPDRRLKVVAYCMASGGFRAGAWEYLRWGHVSPLYMDLDGDGEEELVAARLIVYAGEPDQYYTFITPEAYFELKEWMEYRERFGEKITRDSWLLRDLWNQRIPAGEGPGNGKRSGISYRPGATIDNPQPLKRDGLAVLLSRAWYAQGVRGKLTNGKRRHDFKLTHTFRKYFKTTAEGAGVKSINVETLMGHSIGISDSYYKPAEKEVLMDYLKAVPALSFEAVEATVEEVAELKQKETMNADAIAAIVERMEKQSREMDELRRENERLRNGGGGGGVAAVSAKNAEEEKGSSSTTKKKSPAMAKIEAMQAQLDKLREETEKEEEGEGE